MSKVHQALKRAQEEGILALQGGSNHTVANVEMTSEALIDSRLASLTAVLPPDVAEIELHDTVEQNDVQPLAAPDSLILDSPKVLEERPHTPPSGRDPKTGQFLRFEDVLRNCTKQSWVLDPKTVLFCESNGHTPGTEQFRTLRTRLYQLRETSPFKKVLITSAVASEGKTFVSTNLAQAIARERDRRVLLIDADLRNPRLHQPLGAPLAPGISEYLREEAEDSEIIQHGQEGKLCFIPAGTPGSNPSELLSNGAFEKLLERLAPLFDWVIIDSPPCLPVADPNVLASHCDGVLLVVRANSTPSEAVERARKELRKRNVVGVILNSVEQSHLHQSYYYQTVEEGL